MKCPHCNETLVMADRQGIEIDYCPACRGIWLDRGELDKIIERSADYEKRAAPPSDPYRDKPYDPYRDKPYDPHHKHKKKGFLGDFFDFD